MGAICPPNEGKRPDDVNWDGKAIEAKVIVVGPMGVGKTTMV